MAQKEEAVLDKADRKNFAYTLEKNLDTLIFHEEYEICSQVKNAIEYLS